MPSRESSYSASLLGNGNLTFLT